MRRTRGTMLGVRPVRPHRRILGMSAVFLPHSSAGAIDWPAVEAHVARTVEAGLTPAVNMDTGWVHALDEPARERVLDMAAAVTGGDFVAGAFVADQEGRPFDLDANVRAASAVRARGGTPVVFPSHGLNALPEHEWVAALAAIGNRIDRFVGFELSPLFLPSGRIVSLEAYAGMMEVPQCVGAKHSSLRREAEWDRLAVRDKLRPDFHVFTGNDRAIDMVTWGSDYLLGLATFAPDVFARRDRMWEEGDPRFYEINDVLQYLGHFVFRNPVPGYRHDAAMFFQLRGWAASDALPPGATRRPESDRAVLAEIIERLDSLP